METIILILVFLAGICWFIWTGRQQPKSDNSHPLDNVTKPNVLDVNNDGKVDVKDAVAAVKIVKEEVKTVAKKTATKAKKAAVAVEAKVDAAVTKAKVPRKSKK
jgi:biopolymer transport protein ExbD